MLEPPPQRRSSRVPTKRKRLAEPLSDDDSSDSDVDLDFKKCIKQKVINLSSKGLNDDDLDVLYQVIEQSTILEKLDVGVNHLTLADGKLANAIAKNKTLKVLWLSDNNINILGARHLANALRQNNTPLKDLDLAGNSIGDEGAQYIADMLAVNKSLQKIYLNDNNISDKGAQSLATSLLENTSLHTIDLGTNSIGEKGRNNISPRGVKHLAAALKENNNDTLQTLDLDGNNIGDEGAKYIADMLAVNKTLQRITLDRNKISDSGAQSIATSLLVNTGIREIYLDYNNITDMGVQKLADALESNHNIRTLDSSHNKKISKDVRGRINTILKDQRRKNNNDHQVVTPSNNANISININNRSSSSSIGMKPTPDQRQQMMDASHKAKQSSASSSLARGSISDPKMPASNKKREVKSTADDGLVVTQGPSTSTSRELRMEDAILYLDQVKTEFGDQSCIFNEFLELTEGIKAQKIDTIGVINRVRHLFHGHNSLILGFNAFLPDGYKIEMKEGYKPPPETKRRREGQPQEKRQRLSESTMGGVKAQQLNFDPLSNSPDLSKQPDDFDHVIDYVDIVRKRFIHHPEIYHKFLQILDAFKKKQRGVKEVFDEVSLLFAGHADLLKGFVNYLPGHVQAKKQLEGAIKKTEEKKKASRPVNDQLAEQNVMNLVEDIKKVKALEEENKRLIKELTDAQKKLVTARQVKDHLNSTLKEKEDALKLVESMKADITRKEVDMNEGSVSVQKGQGESKPPKKRTQTEDDPITKDEEIALLRAKLKALEGKCELTSKRTRIEDTTKPKILSIQLDYEHTHCSICHSKFSADLGSKDEDIRKHLPVLSSSKTCDHYFCHGCILKQQLELAQKNNGRFPNWIPCMICKTKTAFCPSEPKYHRLLIDILKKAEWVDAPMVKEEPVD